VRWTLFWTAKSPAFVPKSGDFDSVKAKALMELNLVVISSPMDAMKFSRVLLFCGTMLFTALACGFGGDLSTPIPASPPPATRTLQPAEGVVPRQPRLPTLSPLVLPPTAVSESTFPAWVADFSDPILASLTGRKADIEDEFLNFDQGWFYFIPDSPKGPYYAHIEDEALLLQLPAENEKRDYWVYNPRLLRKNFALRFEFRFLESQPADTLRFQFDQSSERGVALDLSKSESWTLRWGRFAEWQSRTGTYAQFPPDSIQVLVIAKGMECTFYVDDVPLAYLPDCRPEAAVRSSPWAMTFHILAEPGHVASAALDNLSLWDLDKIPSLP
jgi:hypothetical protein